MNNEKEIQQKTHPRILYTSWYLFNKFKRILIPAISVMILCFCLTSIGFGNTSQSSTLEPKCTLTILNGNVDIILPGESNIQSGINGMKLYTDYIVKTHSDSIALLTFFDGSTLTMEPTTEVRIDELAHVEKENVITIRLIQSLGRTWSRVVKMVDIGSRYEIETPSAQAVVRGTQFLIEVSETRGTKETTTEGLVSVSANGEEVLVPKGQQTSVEPGTPPCEPVNIDVSEYLERQETLLQTNTTNTSAQAVPGQSGATPGQSGATPGQSDATPGQSGATPGQSGATPGQSGATPGESDAAPGQSNDPPGKSGDAPGQTGDTPGQSGAAPGQSGAAPGQSGAALGQSGAAPGQSGAALGQSGAAPGQSGAAPGQSNDPPGQSGPVANAGGPYTGNTSSPVSFDGSGSQDADGTIVSYEWDFGDGSTGTGASPTHTYTDPGSYTVSLTVTDDDGLIDTVTTSADIASLGNVWPYFFEDTQRGTSLGIDDSNRTFQFTTSDKVFPIKEANKMKVIVLSKGSWGTYSRFDRKWTINPRGLGLDSESEKYLSGCKFQDRPTRIIIFQYKDKELSISAVAVDSTDFCFAHACDLGTGKQYVLFDKRGVEGGDVKIEPPVAALKISTSNGYAPLTIRFTDKSSGEITTWLWNFGDGSTSTKQNPVHVYEQPGKYTIILTVSGPGGSDTATLNDGVNVKRFRH